HAAEEWLQRYLEAVAELPDHPLRVEADDSRRGLRSIAEIASKPAAAVVAVRNGEVDRQHLDLEHVPGIRSLDVHRTGEDMATRTTISHLGNNVTQRLLNFSGRDSGRLETVRG